MDSPTDILNQLDELWKHRTYDLQSLIQLALKVLTETENPRDCLVDLLSADMEWRWRTSLQQDEYLSVGSSGEATDQTESTGACINELDKWTITRTPVAQEYFKLANGYEQDKTFQDDLIIAEWQIRCRLPNPPLIEDFQHRLSERPDRHVLLVRAMEQIGIFVVTVAWENGNGFSEPLPSVFTLGRQSRHDPGPIRWNAESAKLIIAAADDRRVSAKQFVAQRVAFDKLAIANTSNNLAIFLGQHLDPGQSQVFRCPITIPFESANVKIAVHCH